MTTHIAPSAQTLRPSRDIYRKAVLRDLLIAVPLTLLVVGSQVAIQVREAADDGGSVPGPVIWFFVGIVLAGVIFSVVYYRMLLRNSRIDLGATALTVQNWLGRTRTIDHAAVATVLQMVVRLPARPIPMLFLLDREGRRMLVMYGTLWPTEAMLAVSGATGVPATTFPAAVTYAELRTLYPKAVSWARAHPILLALIVAAAVFAASFVGMIVLVLAFFAG